MSSQPCTFYQKNACNRGSSCIFSHDGPIPETNSSRSSQICRYFLLGTCVFGNRCQRSHNADLKKPDASYTHNEGNSDSYETPVDNGIARSDKRSASEGEDEEVQENAQDSLPSEHVLDPIHSDVEEEPAKPDVQESGPSRVDIPTPPSHINIKKENTSKETCIFFIEGTCRNTSGCDFSHSISKDTKTAGSGRLKGPNLSKSYLYSSFFIHHHVGHRIDHCSKALRLVTQEGLQTLPSGALPTRERLHISPSTGTAVRVSP